jgi:hypothetical protein
LRAVRATSWLHHKIGKLPGPGGISDAPYLRDASAVVRLKFDRDCDMSRGARGRRPVLERARQRNPVNPRPGGLSEVARGWY